MNETFALLWSKSGNCFHIEPLKDTAQKGMRFFWRDQRNDYLLIAMGSDAAMHATAEELRHVIHERAEVRRLFDSESGE